MKSLIVLLVLVSLPLFLQAQAPCVQEYKGEITLFTNKGRLPQLPIIIDGNQGPLTDENGIFRYRLNKCPGMTVRIKLGGNHWDVVNHTEIYSYTIRQLADPSDFQFKLIVAQVQDIERARRQYYATIAGVALDRGLTSMKGDIKKLTDLVVDQQRLITNGAKQPAHQTQPMTDGLEQRLKQQQKEYQRVLDSLVQMPSMLTSRINDLQKLLEKQQVADKHLIDSLGRGGVNQQSKITELEKILNQQRQENQQLLAKLIQKQDSTQKHEKTGELQKLVDQQKRENQRLLDSLSKKEMAWQKRQKDELASNTQQNLSIQQLRDSLARMQSRYQQALNEKDKRLSEVKAMAAVFAKQTAIDSSYQQAFLKYKAGQFASALSTLSDDTLSRDKTKMSARVGGGSPFKPVANPSELSDSEVPKDRAVYVGKCLLKANIYRSQYDMEKAAHWYEEAIHADSTQVENILTYANFLQQLDRSDEAGRWYKKALDLNPNAPLKADVYVDQGYYYMATNRLTEAEAVFQKAKTIKQQQAQATPEQIDPGLAHVLNGLGTLYAKKRQNIEAEKAFLEAKFILEKLVEKYPDEFKADLAYTLVDIGNICFDTQRPGEAKSDFLRAKGILDRLKPTEGEIIPAVQIKTMHRLALLSNGEERRSYFREADSLQGQVVELIEKHFGDSEPVMLARELSNWSYHSLFSGKFAKAESLAEKAISYDESEPWANANLAMAYLMQGKLDDAKALYTYLKSQSRQSDGTKKTFLDDLDELEAAGLTHPDIGTIRKLLSQQGIK
ncbi:tetratricopeptide repeat protein [Spirosoma gilvum]